MEGGPSTAGLVLLNAKDSVRPGKGFTGTRGRQEVLALDFVFSSPHATHKFAVDERNLLFFAPIGTLPPVARESEAIAAAIRTPIGSPPLAEIVRGRANAVILADDLTRTTPQRRIMPVLLDELNRCGIPDTAITIVIALGTHRDMTPAEIQERFGAEILRRVKIVNHDARHDCIDLGRTDLGTPIQINRTVYEAQVKISVGTVVPHPLAGWGGGGKMIQPGVSSELTTDATHFLGGTHERPLDLVGNPENPVRREMETVAARVGLDFVINTVQDAEGRFVGVFAGHFVAAHRAAVRCAEAIFRPEIPERAEIVVSYAHPADLDYWQGYKPFVYSQLAVREGGIIIFVIDAPEGVSGGAPKHRDILLEWSTREPDEILAAMEAGVIQDRNCGAICVSQARFLRRAKVICVAKGLTDQEITRLGFVPAADVRSALKSALAERGPEAGIGVIPYGGETIVRVKGE